MPSLVLIIVGLLVSTAAAAHPGHGYTSGFAHYLTAPVHVVGGVAVVFVLVLGLSALWRRRARLNSRPAPVDSSRVVWRCAAADRDR